MGVCPWIAMAVQLQLCTLGQCTRGLTLSVDSSSSVIVALYLCSMCEGSGCGIVS